jgi:cytochrome c
MNVRKGTRPARRLLAWLLLAGSIAPGLDGCRQASGHEPRYTVRGGDAHRGRVAIRNYGCGACHVIPGIRAAQGTVGPPLSMWERRTYIAGQVPNTPELLVRWLEAPQAIEPGTAMPNLGVTPKDARDIAAYLYTIR